APAPGSLPLPPRTLFNVLAFSPDGKRAAIGGGKLVLWDVDANKPAAGFGAPPLDLVFSAAWSPDGGSLLLGCRQGKAVLLEAATGKVMMNFIGHATDIKGVAFSADGRQVLTGSGSTHFE